MSGAVYTRTSNVGLGLLRFNFPNWGDDENNNMKIIDAALGAQGIVISGIWVNGTAYNAGQIVVDDVTSAMWRCTVSHTSAVSGTFAQDRTARPTYWTPYVIDQASINIGDEPPINPNHGQLWWDSNSGNLYVRYNDVDTTQWVQVNVAPLPQISGTADTRNCIVNGAMLISQETPSGSVPANGYVADQWTWSYSSTGTAVLTRAGPYYAGQSGEDEITYFARLNCTVADASLSTSESVRLIQSVETNRVNGFRFGHATLSKPAVLRFKARSNILGTFAVNLREYGASCSFIKHCTITSVGVWQTFTIPVPRCTIGTWSTVGTDPALVVQFYSANGSTSYGTEGIWNVGAPTLAGPITNWMSATSQLFDIANVGLYVDPGNTGVAPPWQMPDEAEELIACQRYWQQVRSYMSGNVTSAASYFNFYAYRVVPRTVPTSLTGTNGVNVSFPATVGTLTDTTPAGTVGCVEVRTANATGAGYFSSIVTVDARM